jgi:hypothetical protein
LSLACGVLALEATSGCTTEKIIVVRDDGGGTILGTGGGGGGGGAGGRGTGGVGGVAGASPLGRKCLQASECKTGLTCLTADSDAFNPGGPAGGMCTLACTTDDECIAFDPTSLCVGFDSANNVNFCLQGCTEGIPSANKCQGRSDLVCTSLVDQNGNPTVSACQPSCGSDFDCGARKCDFRTGICVDQTAGTLPIGSPCDAAAATDPCNGICVNFYDSQDAAAAKYGVCFATCSLNADGVGCGVDPSAQPPFDVQCLGPSTSSAGDQGLCFQLCDCNGDCLNEAFICRPWGDAQSVTATGKKGYCRGPVDDMGAPVPDIKCSTTPGTGGAGGSAGSGGSGGTRPGDAAAD